MLQVGEAVLEVVPPLKCIRLCYKQQTQQQHGAADLSAGAARHGESETRMDSPAAEVGSDKCRGDAGFR